jgi:hypothetical protein
VEVPQGPDVGVAEGVAEAVFEYALCTEELLTAATR